VIIGGGFGGNFTAVTLRKLVPDAEVVVVEKHPFFISGPASMEYVFGLASLDTITRGYRSLMAQGITVVKAEVEAIEPDKNRVQTSLGALDYNSLVVTSGIRLAYEEISGLKEHMGANAHPYDKSSIVDLRQRIEAFQGGNIVLGVPAAPYKCPPGPYECALLFAEHIKKNKLKAKVIVLDAGGAPQIPPLAKGFLDAMQFTMADQIDYLPNQKVIGVDVGARTVLTDKKQSFKYDLLSIIPPNKAALFIKEAGLGDPFVAVNPATFQSTKFQNIYAVGDAAATPYTKSAYVASVSGKVCAHAIAQALGAAPSVPPAMHNICYPYVSGDKAMLVRADWTITTEEGKPKVSVKVATDINGKPDYVKTRKVWEQGLWREMFGA
jgi:NADPH-dependent 2,4-dienoyl-CoA reductase/sulfur reductase-like enzyme